MPDITLTLSEKDQAVIRACLTKTYDVDITPNNVSYRILDAVSATQKRLLYELRNAPSIEASFVPKDP